MDCTRHGSFSLLKNKDMEPKPILLLIAGSREIPSTFTYEKFCTLINKEMEDIKIASLVNGGASGIDAWARNWAFERGIEIDMQLPEWDGPKKKGAGFALNTKMVEAAGHVLMFWDGESKGTEDTLTRTRNSGKKYRLFLMKE